MSATTCSVYIKYAGSEHPVRYQSSSPQASVERWVQQAMASTSTPTRTYNVDGLTCDGRAVVVNWAHVDAAYVTADVGPDVDLVPDVDIAADVVEIVPDVHVVPDVVEDAAPDQIPTWVPLPRAAGGPSWPTQRRSAETTQIGMAGR